LTRSQFEPTLASRPTRIFSRGKTNVAFLTRSFAAWLALACAASLPGIARAESSLRGARVVWARGDRIYVASPDSVALGLGTIFTFLDRGKTVATAAVTAVHDGELIAAKLLSGSLAKVKHLDKLEIAAEPPVFRSPPVLRVGYPAPGRKNLLFDCSFQSPDSGFLLRTYTPDARAGQLYRFVRNPIDPVPAGWPDTLVVRFFDEVSDEEIALERGDVDTAVFWPGEASTHIREAMHWPGGPLGVWTHDFLAASARGPGVPIDSAALRTDERRAMALMNQALFRGDLLPSPLGDVVPHPSTVGARFEVDASIPGRDSIEQLLNRIMGPATLRAERVVRIFRVDPPPEGETRAFDPSVTDLLILCPVISAPELGPYLDSIGANEMANLFRCLPAPRKP